MAPRAGPLVAACWAKKRHVLEKPWCKDIKAPLEFDEATVVVHQSPPKKFVKKGNRRMELVSICQGSGSSATHFIGRMLNPVAPGCNSRIVDSFCNGTSQAKTNSGK